MRQHPWFSARAYQHIDRPIGLKIAKSLVATPSAVARHPFLPLIHYDKEVRRYSKTRGKSIKSRPIHYASHQDCAIYAAYARRLADEYEALLVAEGLSDCVIAYRRLGKNNVDFAREVFERVNRSGPATTLCFDIESFFPTLDHQRLKVSLQSVLQMAPLTSDWFAVFKSVTRYAWVERQDLENIRQRKLQSARDGRAISVKQFHDLRSRGLIYRNEAGLGIPQGTPISAILANIYMIEFDRRVAHAAIKLGAMYRRYSDDILIACHPQHATHFRQLVERELAAIGLTQNAHKFETSNFSIEGNRVVCDKPLQYLGFTFDGERALIRSSSLSRFYRRMSKSVRRVATQASISILDGKTKKLHRRSLYENFSILGKRNFLSLYVARARLLVGPNAIGRQTKRAAVVLRRKISIIEKRFNLPTG